MPNYPKTKGELGLVTTKRTIQSLSPERIAPTINFSWGPLSVPTSIIVNGNTYPRDADEPVVGSPEQPTLYLTSSNTELTFTADVKVAEGDFITEYEWDFGDGFRGYGPIVIHTYLTGSPSIRTVLCVTDNHGRRFCRGQTMRLRPAALTVVGGMGGG